MKRTIPLLPILFSAALALSLLVTPTVSWSQEEEPEFSELRALIEVNTTDGDAGFQMLIDGDGWKEVKVDDPNGQKIYTVKGDKSVQEQGLTENFFESAEPECSEEGFSLTDTLERFPAGEYSVSGKSIENEMMDGEAVLTHAIPAAPGNLMPNQVGLVNPANTVISWTEDAGGLGLCPANGADIPDPAGVTLFGYQVVVEREDPEPLQVFVAEVGPGTTSITVSPEFMGNNGVYKYEVVAIEERMIDGEVVKGNQSIAENFFCTAPIATLDCELPE
jgi:hypothetical protein